MPDAHVRRRSRPWIPGIFLSIAIGAASGVSAAQAPPASGVDRLFSAPLPIPQVLTGRNIKITMRETGVQIFPPPAPKTKMWTYNGTFPGPTIRRPSGQTTKVTFTNKLPKRAGSTSVHHHGVHSAPKHDGHPHHFAIRRGESRTYKYEFMEDGKPERAATHWYHDHRMDQTGRNVWMGLAGMSILDDKFDAALPLPKGPYDVPLMITDRSFDANMQLDYKFHLLGKIGDHILVNGAPTPHFEVADRKYRFRILNASNVREYRLALDNGEPLVQIGSEAGLLPEPIERDSIVIGPAERIEVVIDFDGSVGKNIVLKNLIPVSDLGGPFLGDVMQFRVRRDVDDNSRVPTKLRPVPEFGEPDVTRVWTLNEVEGAGLITRPGAETIAPFNPVWTINGLPFDPDRADARPVLGSTERWIFVNASVAQHRIHIHDMDWRVVARYGGQELFTPGDPETAMGETGLRETFLVQSGETVEVVSRFTDHIGRYVFHCHILEHEDNAMMAQFEVMPDSVMRNRMVR